MADLSPVETLQAAAAKLRELVKKATPGPWTAHSDGLVWPERMGDPVSGSTEQEDAEWIAFAHPGVAEPLADWLDAQAEDLGWHMAAWTHVNPGEESGFFGQAARDPARLAQLTADHSGRALAVARVLLGVPDGR